MKRIAVYVTGHGYGHFTRTMEISRLLHELHDNVEIHVRAPFSLSHILNTLGREPASHAEIRLDIGLVQHDSLRWNKEKTLQQLAFYYGREGDLRVRQEAEWLTKTGINAALLDIPPRAFEACHMAGVPAYGMTNFSWDWIWADLAEEAPEFHEYADRAAQAYNTCALLFCPQMDAGLDNFPVQQEVPVVARLSSREPEEVRKIMGFPSNRPLVMLSFGGEGLRDGGFPPESLHDKFAFIVTEPIADPGKPFIYVRDEDYFGRGLRYCDLVRAADIIMTKPGYSTVAECTGNKTALVYSNRSRFAEYPYIKAFIETHLPNEHIPMDQLLSGNWGPTLNSLYQKMPFTFPETRTDGARVVADLLYKRISN